MKKVVLFFAMICTALMANAQSGTWQSINWSITDHVLTLTSTVAVVPNSSATDPAAWLDYASDIESVVFPENVYIIGEETFQGCAIKELVVPSTAALIAKNAFTNCTSLTTITLKGNNTNVQENPFEGCMALTLINIPTGSSPNYITLSSWPAELRAIMQEPAVVPEIPAVGTVFTVDGISYKVTDNATGHLTVEVTVSAGAPYTGEIHIPTVVEYNTLSWQVVAIGDHAFENTAITGISCPSPNAITSIGEYAFYQCTSLTGDIFGAFAVVERIGKSGFEGCTELTVVNLPATLVYIGERAFYGCNKLVEINVKSATPATLGTDAFKDLAANAAIFVPDGTESAYETAWSEVAGMIHAEAPSGIVVIDGVEYTLDGWNHTATVNGLVDPKPSQVTIPQYITYESGGHTYTYQVTEIMKGAFENETSLEKVTFEGDITPEYLGWTTLVFDEEGNKIGEHAGIFAGCTNLTTIEFGDNVTTVPTTLVGEIPSLTTVILGENVASISDFAFNLCENVERIVIEATTPPTLGTSAFHQNEPGERPLIEVPTEAEDTYKSSTWSEVGKINFAGASICFSNNVLEIEGHDGESLVVKNGNAELVNVEALGESYSKNFNGLPANTCLVVILNGKDYIIKIK